MQLEIELINGKRVFISRDLDKIYNLCEHKKMSFRLTSSFPFFKLEKKRVTRFKYRTHYNTMNDFFDPKFEANCTLAQFASLVGIEFKPFEIGLVDGDLKYGVQKNSYEDTDNVWWN